MLDVSTVGSLSATDEARLAVDALELFVNQHVPTAGELLTLIDLSAAVGASDQCRDYTKALTQVITDTDNIEFAQICHHFLKSFSKEIPGSLPELQRLQSLIDHHQDLLARNAVHIEERKIYKYDLASEIVLAHRLHRSKMLTDKDYVIVINDLCNYSSYMADSPSTVAHILHDRALSSYERCIEFICEDSSLPMVSLACFTLHKEAFSLLHMEFMKYRAALVFDVMEGEAMIAILNPYNTRLHADVAMLTNTRCHFFMVKAEDYDRAVDAVRRSYLKESGVFHP
jgi:hypothetical protein